MDKISYAEVKQRLEEAFFPLSTKLSQSSAANVLHYIGVDEFEMAYESFLLSLVEEKIQLSSDVADKLYDLGIVLGLNRESVFREDFWKVVQPILQR